MAYSTPPATQPKLRRGEAMKSTQSWPKSGRCEPGLFASGDCGNDPVSLPPDPQPQPLQPAEGLPPGSVVARTWDWTKKLITVTDHLKALEKEDGRLQAQTQELGRIVLDLVKEVRELSGQMKGIEKRLDDKDKMVEAIVKLRVMEEMKGIGAKASK
jgi:hypothetical protein